ncbi:hypothetical protein D3P07_00935 [Paenibacillus sp. 1011MAR3C5]|uniref:hypothetical protein n=1 Tax=Paenibacillus sp. 1011MAR3C5 TaxID=1675787 RepID=UPI000E6CFA82|nr:hypothetical protein [Paenibacillus sp. 1011MAR3C5]RJE90703.1 hypothetical protein D3P07_00935 [Paenibacillus sp. 1011MAR3C5]
MMKLNETTPLVPTIPVIPRDVADAIEWARKMNGSVEFIARRWQDVDRFDGPTSELLWSIPFDTLMAALINGYEIELSPKEAAAKERKEACEILRKEYVDVRRKEREWARLRCGSTSAEYRGFAESIQFAARTLKLDISEVTE